jgi:hypothetical protein
MKNGLCIKPPKIEINNRHPTSSPKPEIQQAISFNSNAIKLGRTLNKNILFPFVTRNIFNHTHTHTHTHTENKKREENLV